MTVTILNGDCRDVLKTLPDDHFDMCLTSPPYWGLRSYLPEGHESKHYEIGLEPTMQEYLDTMVTVCREVWRVLKPEGTFWLNVGDVMRGKRLCMVPNRLAIALQEDGWYVRSEIIWSKPNPMPEPVRDRPTSAHEKVWLLTKSPKYFYDMDAIAEPVVADEETQRKSNKTRHEMRGKGDREGVYGARGEAKPFSNWKPTRNARNVWSISPKPYTGAHFAVMPPELAERCIKAGCPADGHVLDPFGGSGTTGMVATWLGRDATLIELNSEYKTLAARRITEDMPLFAEIAE